MENKHQSKSLSKISDDELLRRLSNLLTQSRCVEAELVAHIGEVEARRLYASKASSMFVYSTEVLNLSEHEAYLRIKVARAARKHPILLEMLGDGRLFLSGIARLAPLLTEANRDLLCADPEAADALTEPRLRALASAQVDPARPGDWNQALMDLGSSVCTPRSPDCAVCPVGVDCLAFRNGTVALRPPRREKRPGAASPPSCRSTCLAMRSISNPFSPRARRWASPSSKTLPRAWAPVTLMAPPAGATLARSVPWALACWPPRSSS